MHRASAQRLPLSQHVILIISVAHFWHWKWPVETSDGTMSGVLLSIMPPLKTQFPKPRSDMEAGVFCVSPPNQSTPLSESTLLISFDLSGPLDTLTRVAYSMSCNAPIFIIQSFRSTNYPLPDFCLTWHFYLGTHFLKLFKSNSWVSCQPLTINSD